MVWITQKDSVTVDFISVYIFFDTFWLSGHCWATFRPKIHKKYLRSVAV